MRSNHLHTHKPTVLLLLLALLLSTGASAIAHAHEQTRLDTPHLNAMLGAANDEPDHVVTTTDDSGPGSLRWAILDAAAGDRIAFSPRLAGQTIVLNSILPEINKHLIIDGRMAPMLNISGNNAVQSGFVVRSDGQLTVLGLTFRDGQDFVGGAFFVDGGQLRLTGVTLVDNVSQGGGAIENLDGIVLVTNSTIHNNRSTDSVLGGGAIYQWGTGTPETTIFYSTITDNTAADAAKDGLWIRAGELGLVGSLLDHVGGSCKIEVGASAASGGYNIDHDGTTGGNPCGLTEATDQIDTPLLLGPLADNGGASMTRAPENASPAFFNVPTGEAGCGDPILYDQRGGVRTLGSGDNCDSGAMQVLGCGVVTDSTVSLSAGNFSLNSIIDSADDGDTLTIVGLCPGTAPVFGYDPATARIRKNLTLVGKVAGPLNGNTIPLLTPPSYIEQPILDAKGEAGVVVVENNATVTLNRLTLTRGEKLQSSGAGLYVAEGANVTLLNSSVRNNAAASGGGVFVEGSAQINFSEISGNYGSAGGGLHTVGTTSTNNSTFSYNFGQGGGAIYVPEGGSLSMVSSTVRGNTVPDGGGGGGMLTLGEATMANTTFADNRAGKGGAIIVGENGDLSIGQSTFQNNRAVFNGGAVNGAGDTTISGSTFTGNFAGEQGGAIYFSGGAASMLKVSVTEFAQNTAGTDGGAMANFATVMAEDVIMGFNQAGNRGGAMHNGGSATVADSRLFSNLAVVSGGAIHNETTGTFELMTSTLEENTTKVGAGAVFNEGVYRLGAGTVMTNVGGGLINDSAGTLFAYNSTLTLNTSGPGILNRGTLTLYNSTITGNKYDGPAGGLVTSGTASVINNIIAGNFNVPNTQSDCANTGDLLLSHSLVGDGSCDAAGGTNNLSGDPRLGPFGDNGGPTSTYALEENSPAIDAGDDTICASEPVNNVDQRGAPRVGQCDIGAYEWGEIPPPEPLQLFLPGIFGG